MSEPGNIIRERANGERTGRGAAPGAARLPSHLRPRADLPGPGRGDRDSAHHHRNLRDADRSAISRLLLATAHQGRLDAIAPVVEPVLAPPKWRRIADLRHAAGNLRSAVRAGGARDPRRERLSLALSEFHPLSEGK